MPTGFYKRKSAEERFEQFVYPDPNTGCFFWGGFCNKKGYGIFYPNAKYVLAHRFAWAKNEGYSIANIPKEKEICHKCDMPSCVNPEHLYLGTHEENMQDMSRRNRANGPKGEKHYLATISDNEIADLRKNYMGQRGYFYRNAKKYNVSKTCIRLICLNKSRRSIHGL